MCQLMTYITCDSSIYIHLIYTLFYTYLEHFANKGSDKVCIFLFDFIVNNLNVDVKHISFVILHVVGTKTLQFMHYVVHTIKHLQSIKITFSIRGHSYLEFNKNMGLVN